MPPTMTLSVSIMPRCAAEQAGAGQKVVGVNRVDKEMCCRLPPGQVRSSGDVSSRCSPACSRQARRWAALAFAGLDFELDAHLRRESVVLEKSTAHQEGGRAHHVQIVKAQQLLEHQKVKRSMIAPRP